MPFDDELKQVRQCEEWFAGMCPDSPAPNVERIKRQVRLAVHEEWFRAICQDALPAGAAGGFKKGVREELARSGKAPSRHGALGSSRRLQPGFLRAAAVAAAVAASLAGAVTWIYFVASDYSELPVIAAFEQYREDDLMESISEIEVELLELELAMDRFPSVDTGGLNEDDAGSDSSSSAWAAPQRAAT